MNNLFKPRHYIAAFILIITSAGYVTAQTGPTCAENDLECGRMENGTKKAAPLAVKLLPQKAASTAEDPASAVPASVPPKPPKSAMTTGIRERLFNAQNSERSPRFSFGAKYDYSRAKEAAVDVTEHTLLPDGNFRQPVGNQFQLSDRNRFEVRDEKAVTEKDKADAQEESEQDPDALRKAAQNPIASLISVPFQNNTSFALGPDNDRTQNVLVIQPVVPVRLTPGVNMIMRFVTPIVYQPNFIVPQVPETKTGWFGLGDINPSFFFSPTKVNKVIWGAGPTFILPTATSRALGQGKLQVGPTFVWLIQPKKWTFGSLFNNTWSVAGKDNRRSTNQGIFQYFINYNLKKGYFLTWSPTITFNWKEKGAGRWTVPFGGGVGRIMLLGKQPVNISVQAFANPVRPPNSSPFTLRFSFALLYPKRPS